VRDHRPTVLLVTNYSGAGGGAEQQLLALAAGVDKKIFRVLIASLYQGNFANDTIPGVDVICLNRGGKYDFYPMLRLMKILRDNHVDIIQPFLSPATLFGIIPATLVGTPIKIITERCGVRNNPGRGYKVICALEDFFGRKSPIAVANSIAGQRMLVERGYDEKKTAVIYNGLNVKRLGVDPGRVSRIREENGLKPGQPIVGIAAWISPAKDHVGFIKCASMILKKRPEVRFAILGDGPNKLDIEVLVKDMGLTEQVVFLGMHNQVGDYLSLFDVAVLSSKDHEGCSNSILEYMYLGKPVVATDVGGNRELVKPGENGCLVPPNNPEALAQAILSLLDDPGKARRFGENGRARILAEFTQEKMVANYQSLWLDLIEKKIGKRKMTVCRELA
jgi:glycosyltransferase involved in cell wall biosynthesis